MSDAWSPLRLPICRQNHQRDSLADDIIICSGDKNSCSAAGRIGSRFEQGQPAHKLWCIDVKLQRDHPAVGVARLQCARSIPSVPNRARQSAACSAVLSRGQLGFVLIDVEQVPRVVPGLGGELAIVVVARRRLDAVRTLAPKTASARALRADSRGGCGRARSVPLGLTGPASPAVGRTGPGRRGPRP